MLLFSSSSFPSFKLFIINPFLTRHLIHNSLESRFFSSLYFAISLVHSAASLLLILYCYTITAQSGSSIVPKNKMTNNKEPEEKGIYNRKRPATMMAAVPTEQVWSSTIGTWIVIIIIQCSWSQTLCLCLLFVIARHRVKVVTNEFARSWLI